MTDTRIDYGNALTSPGVRTPNGYVHIDAYGLAQAQLSFTTDSDPANLTDIIDTYSVGVPYPDSLGFEMKSYKVSINSSEGGISLVTVDYMGITRGNGRTDAQITGICNTQAQPIETHPNFTTVNDTTIGAGSPTQILGGTPAYPSTNPNHPIFNPPAVAGAPWTFVGFGLPANGTRNVKAGVRQYLRPMVNFRGQMFFTEANSTLAIGLAQSVGDILTITDLEILLNPISPGAWLESDTAPSRVLLTSANIEGIGSPDNLCAWKVTYDLMVGGDLGWDYDIYPSSTGIF